jgi:hypothetical protein
MATAGTGQHGGWAVRRRYERVAFNCPVLAWPLGGGPMHSSRSVEISLGGVRIVSTLSASPGELLRLEFHLKEDGGIVREEVAGRVVNVTVDGCLNALGIEFAEPLAEHRQPALVSRIRRL